MKNAYLSSTHVQVYNQMAQFWLLKVHINNVYR